VNAGPPVPGRTSPAGLPVPWLVTGRTAWDARAPARDVPPAAWDARRPAPDAHPTASPRLTGSSSSVWWPARSSAAVAVRHSIVERGLPPRSIAAARFASAPGGARLRRIRQSRSRTRRSCSCGGSRPSTSTATVARDRFVSRGGEFDDAAHVVDRVPRTRLSASGVRRVCALPYERGARGGKKIPAKNLHGPA